MDRRSFLGATGAGLLAAGAGTGWTQAAIRPLPLLPLTDLTHGFDTRYPLNLVHGKHDFGTGVASDTFGINNPYLGPVLRVKQGQTLPFDIKNNIDDVTTVHWHGLHIPGDVDGGPHQEIEPGDIWSPDVPIVQNASMNWFHSHMHGKTALQTYKGLAGVMLIEDDASLAADLPRTYGVDDFTLVLQDKKFDSAGELEYSVSGQVFEDGFQAETLIINGAMAPLAQTVPTGHVRLRCLNACNARFLQISLAEGPLTVIASDGGFLASSVETDRILMSPGERYEVLIDMRNKDANSLMVRYGEGGGVFGFLGDLFGSRDMTALTFRRSTELGFDGAAPQKLANLAPADRKTAENTRSFELEMATSDELAELAAVWDNFCGSGAMAINGLPMNMDRIDETVAKGTTEIWRITVDDMLHPFHIHGCSFRILSQNGVEPPAWAQGWKDMVHVDEGWSEVLVRFDHDAPEDSPYMYHCHILEHEDCGMMGQFTVT